MYRVLRPGGEALIVDLRKDVSLAELDGYIRQSGRRRFDAWMTRWAFRSFLVKRAYTRDQFCQLAAESRFGSCQLTVGPIGFEARFKKPSAWRPALSYAPRGDPLLQARYLVGMFLWYSGSSFIFSTWAAMVR